MNTIGSRIALYRNSRRWTQDKLASELGIAQGLLSDIENDKVSPKWDMINKIAERLEVPVLQLLPFSNSIMYNQYSDPSSSGHIIHSGDVVNNYTSDQERQLWEALLKAKDETIETLKKHLEAR